MNARSLIVQLLVTALGFVAINTAVWFKVQNSPGFRALDMAREAEGVTHVFLGNSTMVAGIDAALYDEVAGSSHSINLGLGSSSAVQHLILYRAMDRSKPRRVIYGFFDRAMTEIPRGRLEDLDGNSLVSFADASTAVAHYQPDSPMEAWKIRLAALLPVVWGRFNVWVVVERARRHLGEFGLPVVAKSQFGLAEDFAVLSGTSPEEFVALISKDVAERAPLTSPVVEILAKAQADKAEAFLVLVPVPSERRARYNTSPQWDDYEQYLAELASTHGATLVDAQDWIDDTGFADPIHLSDVGKARFTTLLAERLEAPRDGQPSP